MSLSSINFNDKKKQNNFYNKNKKIFNINDIDINKILVSKKETYGKYLIGYNDNDVVRPLYLFLSQAIGYITKFDKNEITISLLIKDKQLLKNCSIIWEKD